MIFKNLRVIFKHEVWECDIEVEGGRIKRIARLISDRGIDLEGRYIIFSIVDMHTHMRDWEQKEKETIETGTKAALAGGITTIVDMPNTNPPVQNEKNYKKRLILFKKKSFCNFEINLGAKNTKNITSVFDKYCPPFIKIYLSHTTGNYLFSGSLERLFSQRNPIALHGELGDVRRCVSLSKKHDAPLHVCHIASKKEIEFLSKNKHAGVTIEVTPHHLLLENLGDVKPPIGSSKDRGALWGNMKIIDVIASDHAPHTPVDKEKGAYGFSGVEIMLPLMLDCVNKKMLSLFDVSEKMSENPNRILEEKVFEVGAEASFVVLDTEREWRVDASRFFSKGRNTPFDGREVCGAVSKTFLCGEEVFDGENVFKCSLQRKR